jgi:hypothetical protein
MSRSYYEMLQSLADKYYAETGKVEATTKEIAVWAVRSNLWDAPSDLIINKCREDFSRALREQYIHDEQGRPIRAKHVARVRRGDKQLHLWADIRTARRQHMLVAFQQRREQIVGDCRQLKRDADFYNSQHTDAKPVQLCFDFRDDVEEGEFPGDYPTKGSGD